MLTEQELEAGVLLILASVVGLSFGKMWRPGIYIPHSGSLPHEEYLMEKNLSTEADGTFILKWQTLVDSQVRRVLCHLRAH